MLLECTLLSNWLFGWIARGKIPSKDLKKTAHRHTNQQIRLNAAPTYDTITHCQRVFVLAPAKYFSRSMLLLHFCFSVTILFSDSMIYFFFLFSLSFTSTSLVSSYSLYCVHRKFVHCAPLTWVCSHTRSQSNLCLMPHKGILPIAHYTHIDMMTNNESLNISQMHVQN